MIHTYVPVYYFRFEVTTKGRILYESRGLVTLRVAFEGNYAYFHAQCKAQMKKLLYIVLLKMDNDGMIEESHCECAAGSGIEAHCKHVFTVLHGIEDMVRTKTIILHKVCTEELMSFKKPKKVFYYSPMKSHNLPSKRKKPCSVLYNPIKEEDIMENYKDYVMNLAIGFATTGSRMPYMQVIKPANPYAIEMDHDYMEKSAKDLLLENLLLKNINQQQVDDIQLKTKLQDASKDWHRLRSVRITASNFHAVCNSRGSTRQALANNILYPKKFQTRATVHGKVHESTALQKYENFLSAKVDRCGLCISLTHPFIAASPDGMLQNETIIEVKCPYVARHYAITTTTVPYLYESNGELKLKKKHNYYTQIQGQLFCTNRKYANLVVYTFVDMKIIYIEKDEEFIKEMVLKLTSFYEEYLQPAIFNKYLYKYYDSVIKP